MHFIRTIKSAKLGMHYRRGWGMVGPLPSIDGYTDYGTPYKIDLYWDDNTKSENIARKHVQIVLSQWIRYTDEQVKYIMDNFLIIEKTKLGNGVEIWDSDNSYTIQIKGNTEELPGHEKVVKL